MGLLRDLEQAGYAQLGGSESVRDHQTLYQQTARMVLSPRMKVFDLNTEPPQLRDFYGRTSFGQGCLLARRLIEAGVTFVEVHRSGWDTHNDNIPRSAKLTAEVDPAYATLLNDLKGRGLLDSTLVIWMGEFGRTPKINPNAGRDHFPHAFSVALAGCGVRGGQVIGATSADGTEVQDQPVTVPDLMRSFCHALGINPDKQNDSPLGRPVKIVDGGRVVGPLFS